MERYLVISSDCHAGLPPERYRDYVDPKYREAFDAALPIMLQMMMAILANSEGWNLIPM